MRVRADPDPARFQARIFAHELEIKDAVKERKAHAVGDDDDNVLAHARTVDMRAKLKMMKEEMWRHRHPPDPRPGKHNRPQNP